jgi:hypothetical protein
MTTRRVTIASLSMTDSTTTRYAIYRATLHYNLARSEPYIDLNRGAQHVTTVTRDNRDKESNWHNDDLARRYLKWPSHSLRLTRPLSLSPIAFFATALTLSAIVARKDQTRRKLNPAPA